MRSRTVGMSPRPPSTTIWPEVGGIRPSTMRSVVVLPAPFGPRKPKMQPGSTAKERSRTASNSP